VSVKKLEVVPSRHIRGDDLSLVQRCLAGDRAAQRELFDGEVRRVHAALFRILGTNIHIDDLVQDTFLSVFRSLKTFRGESSLATWIDRCTVRVAYRHLASKRRRVPIVEIVPELAADDPDAERRAMGREAARRLYRELDRLDPMYRVAFVLHAVEGRPLEEIAHLTDASLAATKSRIWRARKALEKRACRDPLLRGFILTEDEVES